MILSTTLSVSKSYPKTSNNVDFYHYLNSYMKQHYENNGFIIKSLKTKSPYTVYIKAGFKQVHGWVDDDNILKIRGGSFKSHKKWIHGTNTGIGISHQVHKKIRISLAGTFRAKGMYKQSGYGTEFGMSLSF